MPTVVMERNNDALNINPPNADRSLTVHGSDWLWAVMAVFGVALLSWLGWTLKKHSARTVEHSSKNGHNHDLNNGAHKAPAGPATTASPYRERILHYLWTLAAFIGFISYFTMASDLGNTSIRQYLHNGGDAQQTRQIYYVRYIYWFLAWPLIITANLLLSGVSWATIFFAIALQEIWVVSWLCGALVSTSYKWGYFVFGIFAYMVLAYIMLAKGIGHARRIRTEKDFTLLAGALVLLWAAFPIAWGLSEGSNKLTVTGEMIFYGILDLMAVPVYGTIFLIYSRRFDPALFQFTQSGRVSHIGHAALSHPGVQMDSSIPEQSRV